MVYKFGVPFLVLMTLLLPVQSSVGGDRNFRKAEKAAKKLVKRSEHFHKIIHKLEGFSHLADDVHELSEAASHLYEGIQQKQSKEHVMEDFDEVQAGFFHLLKQIPHAHGAHHGKHVLKDLEKLGKDFMKLYYQLTRAIFEV